MFGTQGIRRTVVSSFVAAGMALGCVVGGTLPSMAKADELKQVTYLLPAPPFLPAFGPWMVAKSNGYYKDVGIDVTFQMARGGVAVAKQVGTGNALIGGAMGDTPIVVRSNGIPVKGVALLGGGSLTNITVMADSGIKGPADLAGKTATTLSYQDTTYYSLLGALASAGLDRTDVAIQSAGASGVWKLFLAGRADAMAAVPDWIARVQSEGKDVRILPVSDYFPSMAQAILASDTAIKEHPDLIRKIVQATLKGMRDIMNDPEAAATAFIKVVPRYEGKKDLVVRTFKLYNKYVYPGQEKLGVFDPQRLKKVQDFYYDSEIIRNKSDIDDLYTNQFVTSASPAGE